MMRFFKIFVHRLLWISGHLYELLLRETLCNLNNTVPLFRDAKVIYRNFKVLIEKKKYCNTTVIGLIMHSVNI